MKTMKKNIRKVLAVAISLIATSVTAQQELSSAYFMEGAIFRHELNPAFDNQQSYFSFLPLGHLGVGVKGNFGLKDVLFYRNGKTVTYLHPEVGLSEALDGLHENNRMFFNLKTQIVGVGFEGLGGFNTIGINLRAYGGARVPYDLFDLTKNLQNKSYNVSGVSAQVQSYVELALGHSHQIDENWRVGAKMKLLFGAARVNAELESLTLDLQAANQWTATAHATLEANVTGLEVTTKHEQYKDEKRNTKVDPQTGEKYGYESFDNINLKHPGLGGFGMAFDLGAEYDFADLCPGLKASLALLDLGGIHWKESHTIVNSGQDFQFTGFNKISVEESDEQRAQNGTKKFDDQADDLVDRLKDLYNLENKGNLGGSGHGIGATLNIGVEYALPMYDKIRFGFLSTTRIHGDYSWNEERLSVNYAPCNFFDMNINGAVGSFGGSFGWMLNLHPVGFNLFLGMDHHLGKLSKQGIPLSTNADFTFGISFPLSKPKAKPEKPKYKSQTNLPELNPQLLPEVTP